MPALNFKKQFVPAIESGLKTQTIRARRKNAICVGDNLYLYSGQRTKYAKKIANAICTDVFEITISDTRIRIQCDFDIIVEAGHDYLECSEQIISDSNINQINEFAQADGFRDWPEMKQFWMDTHGLPFTGDLIKFKLI